MAIKIVKTLYEDDKIVGLAEISSEDVDDILEFLGIEQTTHNRKHSITSALDHSSNTIPGYILKADTNGLPTSSTYTDDDLVSAVNNTHTHSNKNTIDDIEVALTNSLKTNYDAAYNHTSLTNNPHSVNKTQVGLGNVPNLNTTDAVTNSHTHSNKDLLDTYTQTDANISATISKKHDRQHSITSSSDHNSTATPGKILKADSNGLPVDATNTDDEVVSAVNNSHTHDNKELLDTYAQTEANILDAVSKKHNRKHALNSTYDHTGWNVSASKIPYYDGGNLTDSPMSSDGANAIAGGDIVPDTDMIRSLGSAIKQWLDGYFKQLTIGGVTRTTWPDAGSGSQSMDNVYDNGSVVVVDNTDVKFKLSSGKHYKLTNATDTATYVDVDGDGNVISRLLNDAENGFEIISYG